MSARWLAQVWVVGVCGWALTGCDPSVERDNPYDPASPNPAPAQLSGTVLRQTVDGPRPGPAVVRMTGRDGQAVTAAVDAETGEFTVERPAGSYAVSVSAAGHGAVGFAVDLAIGARVALDPVVLVDETPPVQPRLQLVEGGGPRADRRVPVRVAHPEAGVVVELGGDVASVEGDGEVRVVVVSRGDGLKVIEGWAVDAAGNRSPPVAVDVVVDETPPAEGARLRVAGGAVEVRSREVDVEVLGAGVDTEQVALWACPVEAAVCGAEACAGPACHPAACVRDDRGCRSRAEVGLRVTLAAVEGAQCVCGASYDGAGNGVALQPARITLGPYRPRPVPALVALDPSLLPAVPEASPTVTLRGADIAIDTVADIGAFTSLPCAFEAGDAPGVDDDGVPRFAAACRVTLPDDLRLASGRYPVWLRTPAPVVGGAGRSVERRWLTLAPPVPTIDHMAPMGVTAGAARVEVTLRGRGLTDNVAFALAGRPPVELDLTRDPDDRGAVTARLVFDLEGIAASDADHALEITNPGEVRVELPFGVWRAVEACPAVGVCAVEARRTRAAGEPGRVRVELSVPLDGRASTLVGHGAASWTVVGVDGEPLMGFAAEQGRAVLPLPGPLPGATLRAEVPAHGGGAITIAAGDAAKTFGFPPVCEEPAWVGGGPAAAGLFADLDGDATPDAIMAHAQSGRLSTAVGAQRRTIELGVSPASLAAGELDGDGRIDLVVGDRGDGRVRVLAGRGDGAFAPAIELDAGAPVTAVAVLDLDADRLADIVAGLGGAGGLVRWRATVDGRYLGPERLADGGGAVERLTAVTIDGAPALLYGGADGVRLWSAAGVEGPPLDLTAGAQWWMLTGLDARGRHRLVYGVPAGDEQALRALDYVPGAGWAASADAVAQVERDFEGLALFDIDGEGEPAVVGQAGERATLAIVALDSGAVDRQPSDRFALGRFVAMAIDDRRSVLETRVIYRDGGLVVLDPCERVFDPPPEPDPPAPGMPPLVDGRHAWVDVDGDGWIDLVGLGDEGLAVAFRDRAGFTGGVETPLPPAPAGGLVVRGAPGALTAWVGHGDALVVGTLDAGGAFEVTRAVRLPGPIEAVEALSNDGEVAPMVVTDAAIVIAPGGEAPALAAELPRPPGAAVWRARFDPETPTRDALLVEADDRATLWRHDGAAWIADDLPRWAEGERAVLLSRLGDVTGDGLIDRVVLDLGPPATLAVAVYPGVAPGVFDAASVGPAIELAARLDGPPEPALTIADINDDGHLDLLTARYVIDQGMFWGAKGAALLGRGRGGLTAPIEVERPYTLPRPGMVPPLTVSAVDLTGEGRPELVTTIDRAAWGTPLATEAPVAARGAPHRPPWVDGDQALAEWALPAGWVEALAVSVRLAAPTAGVEGRLIGPDGAVAAIAAPGEARRFAWRSAGGDALADLLGARGGGVWRLELTAPAGPPVIEAAELVAEVRWVRPLPCEGVGCDE